MSENYSYELTRTVDASAARVWQAWTTPDQYEQWAHMAPGSVEQDVREGGTFKATVKVPTGEEFPITGTFREVVPERLLVTAMDMPGEAEPAVVRAEFADLGGTTRVVLSQVCDTEEERDMSEEGSTMLLDGLAGYLARN